MSKPEVRAAANDVANEQDRGERRADFDHEHHRDSSQRPGFSLTNESTSARLTIAGSNSGRAAPASSEAATWVVLSCGCGRSVSGG